ncbi:MAG: subclass B3 metallo-beta-lactamase [Pirellulales bacterium]|nr:subclass B3 metallo-beta-lactamase [Pirellulales bacterium]
MKYTVATIVGLQLVSLGFVAAAVGQPAAEEMAQNPSLFLQAARTVLKWDEPAEPARIAGPIYFVGTQGLGCFLITGSEGHVLLCTGMPGSGELIERSIVKLGFKLQDVKLILTGHAHSDHVGGHAYIKQVTGGKIAMLREEVALFESGGKLDFHYGAYQEFAFAPAKVDVVFQNEEQVKLGDITITALHTPGHTRGSTTYVTKIVSDGKTYTVVFPDGTGVNPGYRISKHPSYEGIEQDFRRTFRILESLKPDIWLACHTEFFGYEDKLARAARLGDAAWVDPQGYEKFVAKAKARFEATVAKEKSTAPEASAAVPVTVQNFIRAETDLYFSRTVADNGIGKLLGPREFTPIDKQYIVRMNRDTLYSSAVFDLDAAPVTISLPDAGKRYMAMQVINQDHYTEGVHYAPVRQTLTKAAMGTRYVFVIVRTLANPGDPADLETANRLRDAMTVEQADAGNWEMPNWDEQSRTEIRDALAILGSHVNGQMKAMFGVKSEVDPILHLIGTAIGWGGNPPSAAIYSSLFPAQNDGQTPYTITVKDVPVDGFWSITVYNSKGFLEKNDRGLYSFNNLSAKPNADGSCTIRFGGAPDAANYLPIMPGWNYTVRLYRPRQNILDGTWSFPEAQPAQ